MVMQLSTCNDTMFPAYSFELGNIIDYCNELYGVSPRLHWVSYMVCLQGLTGSPPMEAMYALQPPLSFSLFTLLN